MKRITKIIYGLFIALLICGSAFAKDSKKSASKNITQNKEDCTFEFGTDLSKYFKGTAYLNNIIPNEGCFAESNVITFGPDSGNADFHSHGEMYVIGLSGTGFYEEEGKDPVIIKKGDVVHIPAGVKHKHGSAKDSWFQQLVIYDKSYKE